MEQLDAHGAKLQNVKEVVGFLHKHLSKRLETSFTGVRKPLQRVFWLVKVDEVWQNSSSFNCDLIKETMKLHSICVTNKNNLTTLMVMDLAFFRSYYLERQWSKCKNIRWTSKWVPKRLQPTDIRAIKNAMFDEWDGQWDYDVHGDVLAATLDIGDNFAINAKVGNLEDVDFWLVCCTKPLHQVKKSFTAKWGTSFAEGDDVVVG
jgi:hypothetical protein